jgi:hypothetical protein
MPKHEINFQEQVWALLELMSPEFNSVDELVNHLLEKSLRLTEIKRRWIEAAIDLGWTEEEVTQYGLGNPSGNYGIIALYRKILEIKEAKKRFTEQHQRRKKNE